MSAKFPPLLNPAPATGNTPAGYPQRADASGSPPTICSNPSPTDSGSSPGRGLNVRHTAIGSREVIIKTRLYQVDVYLRAVPAEAQKAARILAGITEEYQERCAHNGLHSREKHYYSEAHYKLAILSIQQEDTDADAVMRLLRTSAELEDIEGKPNYMIAKILIRKNHRKADAACVAEATECLDRSICSSAGNAGSLMLRLYVDSLDKPHKEQLDNIETYIENTADRKLQKELRYYQGKLFRDGLLGEENKGKAEAKFAEAADALPEGDYRKGKSSMYLGFSHFEEKGFAQAKQYLLQAVRYISARTKQTFTYLFRLHLKAEKSKDSNIDIIADLGLAGKDGPTIEGYFRNRGVDIKQARNEEKMLEVFPPEEKETEKRTSLKNL